MKKLLFFFLFVLSFTISYSQCEAPLVVNWLAENDTTFNIDFVASENSESYVVNFIALYDNGFEVMDPLTISFTGTASSGLNSINHNPVSILTDLNLMSIETYYYKVEVGTVCDGETVWGNDFYMSQNSLLNDENFDCPENMFIPFTYLPDGQDEVYEVNFDVEMGDVPVQIDQLAVMLDLGHTYIGDLEITLTSPGGTSVLLLDQQGTTLGGSNDFSVLFQEGAAEIETTENEGNNGSTVHGIYAPAESFDAFVGEALSGSWTITIADLLGADYGFVYGICLSVETSPCNSSISGTVYYDSNSNNVFDAGEYPLVNGMVNVLEDIYRFTDSDGDYLQCLPSGEHTVQMINPPLYYVLSPDSYNQSTIEGDYLEGVDFALQPIPGINDLSLELYHVSPDRPGFTNVYYVTYTNIGTECIDDVSLLFNTNSEFVEIESIESDDTFIIDGSSFSSDLGTLCPNESGTFVITIYVSEETEVGTLLNSTAVISPTEGDEDITSNYGHDTSEVVASYDPNDITVNYEAVNPDFITDGDKLEYVIRFQNTGNYYAENVLVTNTIEEDLILTSIEILNSSHDVEVSIIDGVAHFDFSNILLAASENDYEGSQGYVRYRIAPTSSFSFSDIIENTAEIYFDFNEAIITNTATTVLDETVDVVELSEEAFTVFPNPSNGNVYIDSKFINEVNSYEIYNLLGKMVASNSLISNEISIENLAQGMYTIKLINKRGDSIASSSIVRK